MPKKKTSQASHARRRVFERYGTVISSQQYKELCNILAKGEGTLLVKQTNTRSVKSIVYNNTIFYVIYDKLRHQIATFLTREMAEETVESYSFDLEELSCRN